MSTSEIATVLIPALSAILVATIEAIAAMERRKVSNERKRNKERTERREKESRLSMDLMAATCGLAIDTARALRDGHTNGTLASNIKQAEEAQTAYAEFIRTEAAHAVSKV
jgi:hypothetical protein